MIVLWIILIVSVIALLLFLYALFKVSHLSDIRAGYDEGLLFEEHNIEPKL